MPNSHEKYIANNIDIDGNPQTNDNPETINSMERKEKIEEVRKLILEILRENTELCRELIANNSTIVQYYMEANPEMTLKELSGVETIEKLPQYNIDNSDEGVKLPTFMDLQRSVSPEFFAKFAKILLEHMDTEGVYCTTEPYGENNIETMRMWLKDPQITQSAHVDWTQNREIAMFETKGDAKMIRLILENMQKGMNSSSGKLIRGNVNSFDDMPASYCMKYEFWKKNERV